MNTKRSYLDSLNTGRTRRSGTSLEHISRTLQEIEEQLDRAYESAGSQPAARDADDAREESRAEAAAVLAPAHGDDMTAGPAPHHRPSSLHDLAFELEQSRAQENEFRSIGEIAGEVRALRGELGALISSGLKQEFDTLRDDIRSAQQTSMRSETDTDALGVELERLSSAIAALPGRSDRKTLQMLRLEVEQVKSSIGMLAREETVEAMGRSFEALASRAPDGNGGAAVDAVCARLEEIGDALARLPETLPVRSLDEKLRMLAGALDQFVEHSSRLKPELHGLIDERLDEISRAIAATANAARSPAPVDKEPFERLEARITSLSHQLEELLEDTSTAQIAESLTALTGRVDDIARRVEQPAPATADLAGKIAAITARIERTADAEETRAGFSAMDERITGISDDFGRRRHQDMEEHRSFFHDLKAQLKDVAARLEQYEPAAGGAEADMLAALDERFAQLSARIDAQATSDLNGQALSGIEARLEELSARLHDSSARIGGMDPEIVHNLEQQIAGLSQHLSQPAAALPDFEDLGPRLARIERLISENREAVVQTARDVAQQALGSLGTAPAGDAGAAELINELKSLETLTRRSDDRNARTFEAIHDTLLKIVERIGTAGGEAGETDMMMARHALAVESAPSIDPEDDAALFDAGEAGEEPEAAEDAGTPHRDEPKIKRTPAQAAADAAMAALNDENTGGEAAETPAQTERKSLLGGVTRALSGRRQRRADAAATRKEPALAAAASGNAALAEDVEAEAHDEVTLDETRINEPLEPGSGTPDLNAIMRRVRDEGDQRGRASQDDAATSDFIAAARRAAQAAAAEAETLKKKGGDQRGSTSRFSIGQALRSRKKTALMGLAGVAIVAGGIGVGQAYLTDTGSPVKAPETSSAGDPAEMTAEPAKSATADTEDKNVAPAAHKPASGTATGAPDDAAPVTPIQASAEDTTPSSQTRQADEAPLQMSAADTEHDARPAGADNDVADQEPADDTVQAAAPVAQDEGETADAAFQPAEADSDALLHTASVQSDDAVMADAAVPAADTPSAPAAIRLEDIPEAAGTEAVRQAAASGDAKAMYEIGNHYAQGDGVEASDEAAADWYEKAAQLGLAPAQYRIGNAYEKAIGVERDLDKARMWYQRAAEQGNASAMHNLGVLYAMGAAGETDNEAAVRWFEKAAQLGVKDSQFNLGILAAKGVGMPKDLEESYKWFALVANTGDKDAAAKRDEVAKALDKDQLENAKARAKLWKPKQIDRDANMVVIPNAWSNDATASVDMKKAVLNVQRILEKNGYQPGPADGLMGERTKSAIVAFQKDNNLQPTGDIGPELVQALLDHK